MYFLNNIVFQRNKYLPRFYYKIKSKDNLENVHDSDGIFPPPSHNSAKCIQTSMYKRRPS